MALESTPKSPINRISVPLRTVRTATGFFDQSLTAVFVANRLTCSLEHLI
jgi:hypothetical protein